MIFGPIGSDLSRLVFRVTMMIKKIRSHGTVAQDGRCPVSLCLAANFHLYTGNLCRKKREREEGNERWKGIVRVVLILMLTLPFRCASILGCGTRTCAISGVGAAAALTASSPTGLAAVEAVEASWATTPPLRRCSACCRSFWMS